MDMESGLIRTPSSTGSEISETVTMTPWFTRLFSAFFRQVFTVLGFGAGKPPWGAPEKSQSPPTPPSTASAESGGDDEDNHQCDGDESSSSTPARPILLHPIIVNLRKQDLGKTVLGVAVPVTTGMIVYFFSQKSPPAIMRFTVVALSVGCTSIWNGLLLRETCHLPANAAEQVGIAIVLLAFNGLVGAFLPSKLLWIPGLSGSLSVVPFIIAALPPPNHINNNTPVNI